MDWYEQLADIIPPHASIAVLGVGSELCGDDAAGMEVAKNLVAASLPPEITVFMGSTAPENFTGQIKKANPQYLLVVDAAYLNQEIGAVSLVDSETIDGMGFSTHMLPLKVMFAYLREETNTQIVCLGIQPGRTDFASPMCEEMAAAVHDVSAKLNRLFARS